jgi:uncharacterized protein (DUF362 family)
VLPKVTVNELLSMENAETILRASIRQVGEEDAIMAARHIVIKPNLCCDKSSLSGATTDVSLVNSILRILTDINPEAQISIVETNNAALTATKAFRTLGYSELAGPKVNLVNLSTDTRCYVEMDGHILDNLMVPETLLEMDYFVSVTKMKTHVMERMSAVLKNQFGCVTGRVKSGFHPFLSEIITDLYDIYRPNLCVVDGCPAMKGFGPTDGVPADTGLLVVGNDAVATDVVLGKLIGFAPSSIPHLRFAQKHHFGKTEEVEVVGTEHIRCEKFDFVPPYAYLASRIALRLERLGEYLGNLGSLIEKVRSAASTVGIRQVSKRVSYGYALRLVRNWIYKKNG